MFSNFQDFVPAVHNEIMGCHALASADVTGQHTYLRTYFNYNAVATRKDWITVIEGQLVTFSAIYTRGKPGQWEEFWTVDFKVNDEFDRVDIKKGRLAISRWLKAIWEEYVRPTSSHLIKAKAYTGDGQGDYRVRRYVKFGFVFDGYELEYRQ